jgi:glycosyl hydrolase family 42 (putative beta-galactosidase)
MSSCSHARWRTGGEYHPTTFWGPNPDDAPESGPMLRGIGIDGSNVTEREPDALGRHLPDFGLKAAPFLEGQPGVFFFGNRHDNEVVPAFRADRANPDRRRREPCFNNPDVQREMMARVERRVRGYDPDGVLYFSITNEGTVTHCCSPFDYCSCPHCADGFRTWLHDEYGDLDAVNAAWGSDYSDLAQIEGMTTDRAKELFRADPDTSLAEWAAFRRFMDWSFHQALLALRDRVRTLAPGVPVALTGVWPPGAFGAQDWECIAGQYDLIECYDEVGEMELARSLCGDRTDLMGTIPGRAEATHWDHTAWISFIHGYRSELIDGFSALFDRKAGALTDAAHRMHQWIEPMKKLSAELAGLSRADDPIFVLHSHASLMRIWVEGELALDEDWSGREWSYPHDHETYLINAMGWYRLIEDAGRQFQVVSARAGLPQLDGAGQMLILPMAVALSDEEIAWVTAFLDGGGTVLYDAEVGRFDEELRPRPGRLAEHERLVRFEHDLTGYARRRCETFEPLLQQGAFAAIVDEALPPAWVQLDAVDPGRFELTTFGGDKRVLAVQRHDARLCNGQPLPDNARPPARVVLHFTEPKSVVDILSGEDHGTVDTLPLTIDPIRPTFLRVG